MGVVASVYGCMIYSKGLTLDTGEDVDVEKVGDEFRQRLGVYGCFMQTIFQVRSVNSHGDPRFCFIHIHTIILVSGLCSRQVQGLWC